MTTLASSHLASSATIGDEAFCERNSVGEYLFAEEKVEGSNPSARSNFSPKRNILFFIKKVSFYRIMLVMSVVIQVAGKAGSMCWTSVRGVEFTGEEARDASDFSEVVGLYSLSPDDAYGMFKSDRLSVGKRLYFAEKLSLDKATAILLLDEDARMGKVVNERLKEERKVENGGIII